MELSRVDNRLQWGMCIKDLWKQHQYIKIFVVRPSVCVCVTDVGVATTNLRFVCKTITCVSAFTEMAIIFLEIVKAFHRNGHYLS